MPIQIGRPAEHGFDEPLGLLSDCHRRIERFLGAMLIIVKRSGGAPLSDSDRDVLEQCRHYFATAGPRHTADEEESLFPRLRTSGSERARDALATLEALEHDHRDAEERHARVDETVQRWARDGDHVTSATALVMPLERILPELAARGVETLVDGAHAPGMGKLDVAGLGATYYSGNLHKWTCAPKGTGFLWVRRDRQPLIRPLTISHGANAPRTDRSRFRLEFDWTGTTDPSGYLAVADAIAFGETLLPGGWPAVRARNRALALEARDLLCAALGMEPPAPDEMIGSMASIPLGWESGPAVVQGVSLYGDDLHDALLAEGIQVMVTPWPQRPDGGPWRRLVRVSAAAHNERAQYERLAEVLLRLVGPSRA